MRLLHDYIAIENDKHESTTKSGLHLASAIKTYPPTGTVKHVAATVKDIKVGDRVLYKVHASVDIEGDLQVVPYSGVIAIL